MERVAYYSFFLVSATDTLRMNLIEYYSPNTRAIYPSSVVKIMKPLTETDRPNIGDRSVPVSVNSWRPIIFPVY